jgi:hypothetical protein
MPTEKREIDFSRCPKHGIRYPTGSECPAAKPSAVRRPPNITFDPTAESAAAGYRGR